MKLSDIVRINSNFKNAINLYLNLNKEDKIASYIPTASSVAILNTYIDAVFSNNGKANLLIGPYGKGKSHLLLVLLSILSKENDLVVISDLIDKVAVVNKEVAAKCRKYVKSDNKVLPVIISNSQDDLRQTFMIALNNALIRVGLEEIMPDTFFSEALNVIDNWKKNYKNTYSLFVDSLKIEGISIKDFCTDLENCDSDALSLFKQLYPNLTSGSAFNPLAGGDVLIMYKSVAEKLKEYGYSGIYIVFDEFSKYIESQSKNAVGQNMKLVQDLCELSDDSKDPQIFMTLVTHKAIKEYSNFLSEVIINAFSGIEGRIRDIEFITSSKNNYELIKNALMVNDKKLAQIPNKSIYLGKKILDDYYSIPAFESTFERGDFETIVAKGCFPLNPCAAYLLLNISEKVAQNERTLFTFISKDEANSLAQYVRNHTESDDWGINADLIYDYFKGIFKKEVSEESIHSEWLNAEYALKKSKNEEERRILKSLAVITIANKIDDLPATSSIIGLSAGVENAENILEELEHRKVLYKNQLNNVYKFKTRAGSELKKEIQKRRELNGDRLNVPKSMSKVSDIQYVLPRQYNYMFSMTRYYKYSFMLADEFLSVGNLGALVEAENPLDGLVVALFSTDGIDYTRKIKKFVSDSQVKNLVVVYTRKPFTLNKELLDYEIIQEIKENIVFMTENEVLKKELTAMEEDLEISLKKYINDHLGTRKADLVCFYSEGGWNCLENYSVEKAVDSSCFDIYKKTLRINNELINKQTISTAPIKKARRLIIERVLKKNVDDDFVNGTGPESTIYRAVLINTGIAQADNKKDVKQFLDIFTRFIDSCVDKRVSMQKLTEKYYLPPYGMRAGVLPIVLAYVLSYRNGDIVVYHGENEIDIDPDVVLDMCDNPAEYELFISEEDLSKETYLKGLIETFDPDCYASLSGTRISNVFTCMQRWYRSLPQVTKNLVKENEITGNNPLVAMLPSLKACLQSADSNAFETIFVDIPRICGSEGDYKNSVKKLKEIKAFLNSYYDSLLDYLIKKTVIAINPKSKNNLSHTLKEWYEKQSDNAKNGLSDGSISVFMNTVSDIKSYDDNAVIQKITKAVAGIYVDSWADDTIAFYFDEITRLKTEVEGIKDTSAKGRRQISFVGIKGESYHRYYEEATDPSAEILKNILSDALDDFSSMSLNDRVAVLAETMEKLINKDN